MYAKVGYDPIKDFATIVRVVHNPLLVVVNPSMPVKSMNDLIALARARDPGKSTLQPAALARRRICRWSS
jgi:tripartite-type tricarboxylate transporter receptor subunit TctC